MIFNDFDIAYIPRVIAHKIYPKTKTEDAEADTSDKLLNFNDSDKKTLVRRVVDALNNSSKTFKLEFEDISSGSVYALLSQDLKDDNNFINVSIEIAEKLAEAHFRPKIPGGYCLIADGYTNQNKYFFLIIKAELQEAFSIDGYNISLIRDIFLSPAKDFYKIGYFIKSGENYIPYMYDDLFSSQKKDLTEYFYSKFLGLTSDKNDALKTRNFYFETKDFIEKNIIDIQDRFGMQKALNVYIRDNMNGVIDAKEFSETYMFGHKDESLKRKYDKDIVEAQFPRSFVKNMRNLSTERYTNLQRINIGSDITLVGRDDSITDFKVMENPTIEELNATIQPAINTGNNLKIIVLEGKPNKL